MAAVGDPLNFVAFRCISLHFVALSVSFGRCFFSLFFLFVFSAFEFCFELVGRQQFEGSRGPSARQKKALVRISRHC
jgi:hypothetical protein